MTLVNQQARDAHFGPFWDPSSRYDSNHKVCYYLSTPQTPSADSLSKLPSVIYVQPLGKGEAEEYLHIPDLELLTAGETAPHGTITAKQMEGAPSHGGT